MDEFDAITAELSAESRLEQVEYARELLAAADATRSFADLLHTLPRGEPVVLVTTDGHAVRGRVVAVGADWLRLAETADDEGTARGISRRIHEIRTATIVRISRGRGR